VLVALFVWFDATAQPAYAYVDPGTGLFLFQMVGSTFAGMMFLLRKRVRRLFGLFSKRITEANGNSGQQ